MHSHEPTTGNGSPQAVQARHKTMLDALTQLEQQHARLLEVYLAVIIGGLSHEDDSNQADDG